MGSSVGSCGHVTISRSETPLVLSLTWFSSGMCCLKSNETKKAFLLWVNVSQIWREGTLFWWAVSTLLFWLHIIQRGATALCTALKPVKSKELSLLFHLCVAVTDKGRQSDDNEEARYHQTVITMVTTALCGCQSTALIVPWQNSCRSKSTDA